MHLCTSPDKVYADAAVLISFMNYEEVEAWADLPIGRRGAEYEAFKQEKTTLLLDLLEQQMPGTRSCIQHCYTSSPLTYLDYTGTAQGSMYGILRDCGEHAPVSQRTRIPNLFQTGQNINSHGILGVIIGSIITSGELLSINTIIEQIKERNT
jgi:all-trans-retinol 13,14-reductase